MARKLPPLNSLPCFEAAARHQTFDSYTFAVEAAVQGEGVVLGRTMLVASDLASGRLIRPFKHALKSVSSFFLVYPPEALRQSKVREFRDWLLAEVAAEGK
jgi:LysR family transcriptional regulator, glycine cleavage system transcriptional activator